MVDRYEPSGKRFSTGNARDTFTRANTWLWRRRTEPDATEKSFLRFLLPREVWLHRSALLDYRFVLFDKVALGVLIAIAVMVVKPTEADTVAEGARWAVGNAAQASLGVALAYTVALLARMDALAADERAKQSSVEQRLRNALAHGGAKLVDFAERGDGFRVSYTVEGQQYTSSVAKDDLTVQVAGICLSGLDHHFDLASLVGVLREADGDVVAVGQQPGGLAEEHYWRVHPRR